MTLTLFAWLMGIGFCWVAGVFLLSKCLFLAPFRLGWLMVMANLVYEVAERKVQCRRNQLDGILWLALVAGSWCLAGAEVAAGVAVGMGLAWVGFLTVDARWRSGSLARPYAPLRGRVPLPIPQLIVSVRGPILERSRTGYELGDWPEGLEQDFDLLVLNPTLVCAQLPLAIEVVSTSDRIEVVCKEGGDRPGPGVGEVVRMGFSLRAVRSGAGGEVQVQVRHGDFEFRRTLRIRSVVSRRTAVVCGAKIERWKSGARAGFVWRGDQDLYDPATFQSTEGLRVALGLARRFRMPSSLMLSARLSLVQEEHRSFCDHFGWDRKSGEIPEFIRFLREAVDTVPEQEWPTVTERPFSAEIGNHFYLHYGTHVAADSGNGWKSHARPGDGAYAWISRSPADSFVEQRDNALACSQVFRDTIGVAPASFTIPGDVFDQDTARAVEAAGLDVGSETDASKASKLFRLSPPHHPAGCRRFVELPRMHPRDPENAGQVAMLKYWMGAARRTGRVLVFLAHHHLTRYEGEAGFHFVEELLRHVLADQEGDVYVGTLTAVGRYWRDVLSERTRCVTVTFEPNRVTITNSGSRPLAGLPLEVTLAGGGRHMRLVTVPANSDVVLVV